MRGDGGFTENLCSHPIFRAYAPVEVNKSEAIGQVSSVAAFFQTIGQALLHRKDSWFKMPQNDCNHAHGNGTVV